MGNVDAFDAHILNDVNLFLSESQTLPGISDDRDRLRVCQEAAMQAGYSKVVDDAALRAELKKAYHKFISRPQHRYVYVTSLTDAPLTGLRRRTLLGGQIRFASTLPPKYDRSFLQDAAFIKMQEPRLSEYVSLPSGPVWLLVGVEGRSEYEAVAKARDSVDLLRGVWNLSINESVWDFPDRVSPINRVLAGPVHTIHSPSGAPLIHLRGHSIGYRESQAAWPRITDSNWSYYLKSERRTLAALRRPKVGEQLARVIIRYCRALDEPDPARSFLDLWGILETLTGTTGERYDDTIKRAAALFRKSELIRYGLEAVRYQRNQLVHHGEPLPDALLSASIAHRHVARLTRFALQTSGFFRDLGELGAFLSLPVERESLSRHGQLHRRAMFFRGLRQPRKRATPGNA